MRALPLLAVLTLILTACGKDKNKDSGTTSTSGSPTGVTWVTDSGTTPTATATATATGTGTGTGTATGGSGSGGSGTSTITTFVGDVAIDLNALTWTGTESARVMSTTSGNLVCQWTWTALDWPHDPAVSANPEPAVSACTDADGNPCLFDFTVNLSAGTETDGSCTAYTFATDAGAYHYGYTDDWFNTGVSYGSQFAYYLPGGNWFPVMQYGTTSWTPAGQQGQLDYEILKTMLGTYTTP